MDDSDMFADSRDENDIDEEDDKIGEKYQRRNPQTWEKPVVLVAPLVSYL